MVYWETLNLENNADYGIDYQKYFTFNHKKKNINDTLMKRKTGISD